MRSLASLVVFALALQATLLPAQAAQRGGGAQQPRRDQLERQIQERMATIVQRQLGLTGPEMRRLQQVNQKFDVERRQLFAAERETRRALRDELARGNGADQRQVDELLGRALTLQRERLDLFEREQRELSAFLTPVQRARYFALEEQMRRRVEELRRRRALGVDSANPGPPRFR